ncbi:MAG: penicillin-binding protein 2 [Actinomycetota bacterium]
MRRTDDRSGSRSARAGASRRRSDRRPTPRVTRSTRTEAVRKRISAPPPGLRDRDSKSGSPRRRLIAALLALTVVLVAIVVRVAMLQTRDADELRAAGTEQWVRTQTIEASRGTIFDRHGNELAMSVPAADVSINPKLLDDGMGTVRLLDDLLDLPDTKLEELTREVAERDRGFVYVARQVDADVGTQIESLRLAGVNVDPVARRQTPGGDTGRTVIGATDIDGNGIAGLEMQYDELLTGTPGSLTREIAPGGRTIPGSEQITEDPVAGRDLVLSIDRAIQFSTEQVMLDRVAQLNARGGLAVVMDVDSGEIYANVSIRRDADTGEAVVTNGNFVAVDSYEPGSVAKVITVAAALDAGVVTPETTFEVPWRKQYYDDLLKDAEQHDGGQWTVNDILVRSSNIGTITIQEELGRFVHHDYMVDFGLGQRTALDFPGESPGVFKDADELWGSERVTVAYGQGMSSTPIQMVAAVNAVANGGVYVAPKLTLGSVEADGSIDPTPPSETRRVVSELAAFQTTKMMEQVVCQGTATRAQVPGISIAGKTGTAFKAADNGTYFDDNGNRVYYSSFVGFFPAEDPQVTVLVAVDEPPADSGDRFGGTAAAPVFGALTPTLIHELGIQPPEGTGGCPE